MIAYDLSGITVPELPARKSEPVIAAIADRLGNSSLTNCPMMAVAFIHTSYLNELRGPDKDVAPWLRLAVSCLGSLGRVYSALCLNHIAYEKLSLRTGEVSRWVGMIDQMIVDLVDGQLRLSESCLMGRGERQSSQTNVRISSRSRSILAFQYLGAVRVCGGYETLHKEISLILSQSESALTRIPADHKSWLQEYAQGKGMSHPTYLAQETRGSGNQVEFEVIVRTDDGKSALGRGPSKRQAGKSAAEKYLQKYAPDFLSSSMDSISIAPVTHAKPSAWRMPVQHINSIRSICDKLQFPTQCSHLLSQALVQRSFVNEHFVKGDNRELAQLGAHVLTAVVHDLYAISALGSSSPRPDQLSAAAVASRICQRSFLAECFDDLGVDSMLLVGKGQPKDEETKVDALQAILGGLFLCRSASCGLDQLLPGDMFEHVSEEIQNFLMDPADVWDSPKSRLQTRFQAMQLKVHYEIESEGEVHEPRKRASIVFSSPFVDRRFRLVGSWVSRSRQSAEAQVAAFAVQLIDELNSATQPLERTLFRLQGARELGRFLLTHELRALPSSYLGLRRWYGLAMLGSRVLINGGDKSFVKWARFVDELFDGHLHELIDPLKVERYYRELMAIARIEAADDIYGEGLEKIGNFLKGLDPDLLQPDIRSSKEFQDLVDMSKLTRVLNGELLRISLSDAIQEFLLLRKQRRPHFRLVDTIPSISLFQPIGAFQTLLAELATIIETDAQIAESGVDLHFCESPAEEEFILRLKWDGRFEAAASANEMLAHSRFWNNLLAELPVNKVILLGNSVEIRIAQSTVASAQQPMVDITSSVLRKSRSLRKPELETMGRLLHDLKNQLVAYQVALTTGSDDRTSQLRSKYEASKHLDRALTLWQSVSTIQKSMAPPEVVQIDVRRFFQNYVAERILTIPLTIRLSPPKTVDGPEIWTASLFLKSILDNLIKNAVEAMPLGGEIQLDWICDDNPKSLIIEVTDNGPGIPPDLQRRLLAGEPIQSSKTGGSALGIATIRSMLSLIDGALLLESSPTHGTRWTIVLPSLDMEVENERATTAIAAYQA